MPITWHIVPAFPTIIYFLRRWTYNRKTRTFEYSGKPHDPPRYLPFEGSIDVLMDLLDWPYSQTASLWNQWKSNEVQQTIRHPFDQRFEHVRGKRKQQKLCRMPRTHWKQVVVMDQLDEANHVHTLRSKWKRNQRPHDGWKQFQTQRSKRKTINRG